MEAYCPTCGYVPIDIHGNCSCCGSPNIVVYKEAPATAQPKLCQICFRQGCKGDCMANINHDVTKSEQPVASPMVEEVARKYVARTFTASCCTFCNVPQHINNVTEKCPNRSKGHDWKQRQVAFSEYENIAAAIREYAAGEVTMMLLRIRASLQARLEDRNEGGDIVVMQLVDAIVAKATAGLEAQLTQSNRKLALVLEVQIAWAKQRAKVAEARVKELTDKITLLESKYEPTKDIR